MKWMNINYLKMHSRIDYDCEDALLEQYGNAAEEFILDYIERTYENLIDIYGEIPARLYECAQLLVDTMYHYRTPITINNMSTVDYGFDAMISKFVRHTKETPIECELNTLLEKLGSLKTDFDFAVMDQDETPEIKTLKERFDFLFKLYSDLPNPTTTICAKLRTSLASLTTACDPYINPVEP